MNQEIQKIIRDLPDFHDPGGPARRTFPNNYFQLGHKYTKAFSLELGIRYNIWDLLDKEPEGLGLSPKDLFILLLPDVIPIYQWDNEHKHWNKIVEDIHV